MPVTPLLSRSSRLHPRVRSFGFRWTTRSWMTWSLSSYRHYEDHRTADSTSSQMQSVCRGRTSAVRSVDASGGPSPISYGTDSWRITRAAIGFRPTGDAPLSSAPPTVPSDQVATRGVGFPGFDGYQWRSASRGQSPASASSSYKGRDGREREADRLRDRRSPGSAASGRWACGCPLAARCAWPPRATTRCRRCTTVTTSRVSRNASKHSNPLESPTPSHIAATTKPTAAIRYRCTNRFNDASLLGAISDRRTKFAAPAPLP